MPSFGKSCEVRVQRVEGRLDVPVGVHLPPVLRPRHHALARPALRRVDRVPPADAVRPRVGRGPRRPVALAADRPRREDARHVPRAAVRRRHERDLASLVEHARRLRVAVDAPVVLGVDEGPVLVEHLGRHGHAPLVAEVGRLDDDEALVADRRRELEPGHALVGVVGHAEARRSRRSEVADVRRVGALGRVDARDRLGDDEVQVREALAVRVAHGVDGHVVDEERHVGAVVEVEAAREVLLRLAAAGVLHGEEAGHDLEQPLGAEARAEGELVLVGARVGRRVALGRCADGHLWAIGEHEGRLIGALLHRKRRRRRSRGRGRGQVHRRPRRRRRRRVKLVRELDRRLDGSAVAAGGLERELADCGERGLVEAVAGRRGHARVGDRAGLVDDHLEADGRSQPVAQGIGRIGRLGAATKHGGRDRLRRQSRDASSACRVGLRSRGGRDEHDGCGDRERKEWSHRASRLDVAPQ